MNSFVDLQDYKEYPRNFSNSSGISGKNVKLGVFREILNFISQTLYKRNKAKILMLSLSGSRACGWERDNSDYDIYGIFSRKGYWNRVSVRRKRLDITLYELDYIFTYFPKYVSFDFFQNILAYPIYVDPEFDYKGLGSFYDANLCHPPLSENIDRFFPKSILHLYGQYLSRIYFLKTRKFSWDIFGINKRYYNFKMLPILRDKYLSDPNKFVLSKGEEDIVKNDLGRLKRDFKMLKNRFRDEKVNTNRLIKWEERVKKLYWRET